MTLALPRRTLLQLIAGVAATTSAKPAGSVPPDLPIPPASAREARLTWARLVGDLSGRTIFFFTHGSVWGFKPQADDLTVEAFAKRLYGYSGVAARKLERRADGEILIRQKHWAFYRDPETDAITDRIANPYTGRTDTAAPMSGPVAARPLGLLDPPSATMPYGMRIRRAGPTAVIETSAFHRFQSPGISWHKLEGNLDDYVCRTADLDSEMPHVPSHYSQNLIAEWQTWTGMHGTPGHILFKGNGEPLTNLDAVPTDQIAAIERAFPDTLAEVRGW